MFDQHPKRICILQGRMAAQHSKVVSCPIKEMVGGVEPVLIKMLLDRYYIVVDLVFQVESGFAQKKDGTVVKDLGDLTYEETVLCLVRLMFVVHQTRWIDVSLSNLVGDWLRRVEERFAGVNGKSKISILQSYSTLDQPAEFLKTFFETYPEACDQLVAAEDKAFFLSIVQRPGQKPVPFIPILDANFEVWFKKDSPWYSEDIDAVFDQDPQRVCILQGPVAARHSKVANRPTKEMLGGVESALIEKLLDRYYEGDESKIPYIDYIGASPSKVDPSLTSTYGIDATITEDKAVYKLDSALPPTEDWLETLSGASVTWLRALLRSTNIVHNGGYQANPLKRLFAPRANQQVVVNYNAGVPTSVVVIGAARSFGAHKPTFEAVSVKFETASNVIAVTIFEDRTDTSVPLSFTFEYRPEQGYTPIHEIVEGRNRRIKEFYLKLWFGDHQVLPNIDIRDTFIGPEVTIDASTVERFCSVVGNQGESFKKARNAEVEAPMDFAIVTGWQAIMRAIFPESIDGDLLKLVHLSNGFRALSSARPLKAGDVCRAEARIVSVINSDSGKTVKVRGNVLRDGQPVIEVNSSFLYRGRFTDYQNTFEIVDEPEYIVTLADAAAVGVLQSKEWFDWENDAKPLLPGTHLVFQVESGFVYKDKNTYSSINVTGRVFVRDQLKTLIPVATVDYNNGVSVGNPVTAYLQRHGKEQGKPALFETPYSLSSTLAPSTYIAPSTNEPYSKVSGDFNPIHINPYFSDFASLPGTITHGMWSSAATRKFVETIATQGKPNRVLSFDVNFTGMVLPGDEVSVKLSHIGMKDGNMVVKVETTNQRGDKIIQGTAEVAQPPTVYVFTGQGSQEPGMSMDLYNSSPAARAVWDGAGEHLLAVYGFSIIELVKQNPKEKTIHFGGIKGQAIRQRYIDMTYDTMDKDGNVKTLPLFADINNRTPKYTFSHPSGLLFATQFAQIAVVVIEKAAFDDMRSKGLVQPNCAFAGHSLGEYSALASIADVLPISSLVDVVFYRGITMQRAVERDAHNRSNYAMCAVNPSRISKTFNEAALREVVESIARRSNVLLEIVNYNVEGSQYVCAGHLLALQSLTNVLNYLKKENIDIQKLAKSYTVDQVKEVLQEIVDSCIQAARKKQEAEDGYIILERGFATIPLPGIDVPFHSRYLWAGVMPFRAYLSKKINSAHLNPDLLVGKYIPNLIAKPFDISREYAQLIYDQTSSPRLDMVLKNWERDNWTSPEQRQNLAYTILVELLAYQFVSPVRWIETQDLLFSHYNFERLIELGPGPTLTGMATRTLKAKYEASDDSVSRTRAIFCHAKHTKEIYNHFEDEAAAPAADEPSDSSASTSAPVPVAAAAIPVSAPSPSSGPVASIADEPLKALDTLRVIIAQKLKKIEEIPFSKSIKDLVGGKSTLQNEILGDLNLEFSSAPEKGEELPLVGETPNYGRWYDTLRCRGGIRQCHIKRRSMQKVLKPLQYIVEHSMVVRCWDGVRRRFFPFIHDLVGDYEEQATMTLTRGPQALFPCPSCKVPFESLHDLSKSHAMRTADESYKIWEASQGMAKTRAEKFVQGEGLHACKNAFWILGTASDPHRAVAFDELHAFSSGVFGKHAWPLTCGIIIAMGDWAPEHVDSRIDNCPRWAGLNHFQNCMSTHFTDGKKFDDLLKVILLAVYDLGAGDELYPLLRLLRTLAVLRVLCTLVVHTEETLQWGESELLCLNECIKAEIIPAILVPVVASIKVNDKNLPLGPDGQKNWNILKYHQLKHAFAHIRRKGASLHHSSRPWEKCHDPLRRAYLITNKKNIGIQITQREHDNNVLNHISDDIDEAKAQQASAKESLKDDDGDDEDAINYRLLPPTPSELQHVTLGAPWGRWQSIREIEGELAHDRAFKNFGARFKAFLSNYLGQPIPTHGESIIEYRTFKVLYTSRDDWQLHSDILRCNPSFHGRPRYDSVIVDTGGIDKISFAKLVFMFKCNVYGTVYNIALVRYYHSTPARSVTPSDKLTGFQRVTLSPPKDAEFLFLNSVIRGAYIAPTSDTRPSEFFVNDLIDSDMYIRLRDR